MSKAIVEEDKAALRSISAAWRTDFDADALAQHVDQAVSTGPYAVDVIVPGERVELVRNDEYAGRRRPRATTAWSCAATWSRWSRSRRSRPARSTWWLRRTPATCSTRSAEVTGADVRTGGDSTLQLQLQAAGAGAFDPATYGGDAAVASAVRQAFLLTVPRDALVSTVVAPLWPEAVVAAALLPTVGPDAGGDVAPSGPADIAGARRLLEEAGVTEPVTVRVLVNTTDPLRAAMLALITESASEVGFEVEPYAPVDGLGPDLVGAPDAWDAALVPVPQSDLPLDSVLSRWRTGGATNVTGWSDPAHGRGRGDARADRRPARRRRGPAGRRRREPRRRGRGALAGAAARRRRHAGLGGTDRRDHPGGARRGAAGARPGGPDLWWAWARTASR